MKKSLLLSTALVMGTLNLAYAGGMAEPVMDAEVVAQQTSSSSGGIIVPLLLLLVIAAVASSGSGGGGAAVSDMRLKEDVTAIGMTAQGLTLYRWRYKGMPGVFEGVMAQDVERLHPSAVVPLPFGYKAVDYDRLGLKMSRVS